MPDEHPQFEHNAFVMLRNLDDNDCSKWWSGNDSGAGYVATPAGEPLEVTITGSAADPVPIVPTADPTLGLTGYNAVAINAPADLVVTPGNLYYIEATNPDNAALAWVHFFNVAAASVVLGTTVPIHKMALPLGGGASTTAGIRSEVLTYPIPFSARLSAAVVTTFAHAASAAVASPVPVIVRGLW